MEIRSKFSRAAILLGALAFLWHSGVDVFPGHWNESAPSRADPSTDMRITDFFEGRDPLVRLTRSNGRAVSEADEAKLLPILEDLEAAIEAAASETGLRADAARRSAKAARKALKKLEILSDKAVDNVKTKADVRRFIEQMGATVSLSRHVFRFSLAVLFVLSPEAGLPASFTSALVIELFLIFLPYGHIETTKGRHFAGERTWAGMRRIDYGLFLMAQALLIGIVSSLSTTGSTDEDHRPSLLIRVAEQAESLVSGAFFSWVAYAIFSAAPRGWALHGGELECAPEFTLAVAEKMHLCYLGFLAAGLVRAALDQIKSGRPFWSTISRSPQDHWFWFLVLYFTPYEDAAVPMMMACARRVASNIGALIGYIGFVDNLVNPGECILFYFLF